MRFIDYYMRATHDHYRCNNGGAYMEARVIRLQVVLPITFKNLSHTSKSVIRPVRLKTMRSWIIRAKSSELYLLSAFACFVKQLLIQAPLSLLIPRWVQDP